MALLALVVLPGLPVKTAESISLRMLSLYKTVAINTTVKECKVDLQKQEMLLNSVFK